MVSDLLKSMIKQQIEYSESNIRVLKSRIERDSDLVYMIQNNIKMLTEMAVEAQKLEDYKMFLKLIEQEEEAAGEN